MSHFYRVDLLIAASLRSCANLVRVARGKATWPWPRRWVLTRLHQLVAGKIPPRADNNVCDRTAIQTTKSRGVPNMNRGQLICSFATLIWSSLIALPVSASSLDWVQQLGTSESDSASSVFADRQGNVYVSGSTAYSPSGKYDTFVNKYDADGNQVWVRQLSGDVVVNLGVSGDGLGNLYISGYTNSNFATGRGDTVDAYLVKYDSSGNLVWTRQFAQASEDYSYGVSADSLGNVFIAGYTFGNLGGPNSGGRDAFVTKYDVNGSRIWTRQLGSTWDDWATGLSADGLGNVYLTGITDGALAGSSSGGRDAFLTKYDASGNRLWVEQLGPATASGISVDSLGNVFVTGSTSGGLDGANSGLGDAFVAKYDSFGNGLWIRQLGTSELDRSDGVTADGLGNVYITGGTRGDLGGPNSGRSDAFVAKYSGSGELLWSQLLGTSVDDSSHAVSTDGQGNIYVAGDTAGTLGSDFVGGPRDAFLAKFRENAVPEPGSLLLIAPALILLGWCRSKRRSYCPVSAKYVASVRRIHGPATYLRFSEGIVYLMRFCGAQHLRIRHTERPMVG